MRDDEPRMVMSLDNRLGKRSGDVEILGTRLGERLGEMFGDRFGERLDERLGELW